MEIQRIKYFNFFILCWVSRILIYLIKNENRRSYIFIKDHWKENLGKPENVRVVGFISYAYHHDSILEMIQRRAARWVKNICSRYVSSMLDDMSWRSLEIRRTDAGLIIFHRIIYDYVAIQVPPYFERPEVPTRHTHPLAFRRIHTYATYSQQPFYPATIVFWNKLDSEIVLISDLNSFMDRVRAIS